MRSPTSWNITIAPSYKLFQTHVGIQTGLAKEHGLELEQLRPITMGMWIGETGTGIHL